MMKLTEGKEKIKQGGSNAKQFAEKLKEKGRLYEQESFQEEIASAYELLNGNEQLTEAAADAAAQFQTRATYIEGNKLVVPYGDGDFEFAEGDYFEQDQERGVNIIDLEKYAASQGIGGGSPAPATEQPAAPAAEQNKPAKKVKLSSDAKDLIDDAVYRFEYEKKELGQDEFKAEATSTWGLSEEEADAAYQRYVDKAKINTSPKLKQEKTKGTSVDEIVKRNIENDIEPSFTQIAQEFGIAPEEVIDIYNNQLEQNDAGTQIDTAGANPAPAGAFGDIEPETQQLAGMENDIDFENAIGPIERLQYSNPENAQGFKDRVSAIIEREGNERPLGEEEINQLAQRYDLTEDEVDKAMREIGAKEKAAAPLDVATPEQVAEDFGISLDEARSIYDEETANELGVDTETDSLFENTPEKEMVDAEQLAGQGDAPLSQLTDKIQTKNILSSNESSVEGTLPNGSQFIVTDTGTGLQYQIVNGPDGDQEPLNVGYDEFDTLVDFINNDGKESAQPATFEVADENNLTPDEFQRMDFEAGEADNAELERIGSKGFEKLSNAIQFDRSVITNDQIQQVAQELGLEGKTPEQLQQIRNGVVKQWETTTDRRPNKSVALSAITAAIDSYIMGGNRNKPAAEPAGQGQQTKDKDTGNINGKQYSVELVNGKPVSGVIDGKGFSIDDDGVVTTRGGRGSKDFYETVTSLKRMYQEGLQPREEAAKPAQSQEQIKQTAQANAQQVTPQAPAKAAAQPQTQPGKIDRKKLEQAAGDLGVNADLLEGLLELLKKVR